MGNPKTAACLLSITLPQETIGLMLQFGVNVLPSALASAILILSRVMTQEASRPRAPVITSITEKARPAPTGRGASPRWGSGSVASVETSLTVVLLITPIPSLRWLGGQGHCAARKGLFTVGCE